jgi:uncharacterized membrane protein
MNPKRAALALILNTATIFTLTMCKTVPASSESAVAAQKLFTDEVKPIFQQHCLRCHSGTIASVLDLSNHATAFMPHPTGRAYIVPGKPDDSLLIEAVSRDGLHQRMMPPLQVTLTDMEIGTLREWIEAGAPWPTGTAGSLRPVHSAEHP